MSSILDALRKAQKAAEEGETVGQVGQQSEAAAAPADVEPPAAPHERSDAEDELEFPPPDDGDESSGRGGGGGTGRSGWSRIAAVVVVGLVIGVAASRLFVGDDSATTLELPEPVEVASQDVPDEGEQSAVKTRADSKRRAPVHAAGKAKDHERGARRQGAKSGSIDADEDTPPAAGNGEKGRDGQDGQDAGREDDESAATPAAPDKAASAETASIAAPPPARPQAVSRPAPPPPSAVDDELADPRPPGAAPASVPSELPADPIEEPLAPPVSVVSETPPAGAPEVFLLFIQWSAKPERRVASLRGPGGRLMIVKEGDIVEGMKVTAIRHDAVEFQWRGNAFRVLAGRAPS